MTTNLNRAVVRQTTEYDHRTGQPFVVKLEEGGKLVRIRPKRSREWYTITVRQLWVMAARNKAEEIKKKKAEEKAAKKEARKNRS